MGRAERLLELGGGLMKLKTVSTGSKGNCYILENDTEALILDAGASLKDVKVALNFNIAKIKCVLVTHHHKDHSAYVQQFQNIGIEVFVPYQSENPMKSFKAGGFKIQAFELSDLDGKFTHTDTDGSECPCYGFHISHEEIGKLIYFTDTNLCKWKFKGINHFLIGVNYSEELVDMDRPEVRHRLQGHMSIETAMEFIRQNVSDDLRNVVMCHLSDAYGNGQVFVEKMQRVTDVNVVCAKKGLEMDVSKYPF